jgi:hypothetical protein
MTLNEYIEQEIRLVKANRKPNAISVRFVQLHEQVSRTEAEAEEYLVLYGLMRSRWRWFRASHEASLKSVDGKGKKKE